MLQVILLTAVSISTLLKVSKEDKRLWFGRSPGVSFFPLLFSISSRTLGPSVLIVVERICNPDTESPFTYWVQRYSVQLIMLLWNWRFKGNQGDIYLLLDAHSVPTGRSASVLATLCLGTSLSLEIPVLHRGGKRQARAEMDQAVCICTCRDGSFCLYADTEDGGTRKPGSFTSAFQWGSLTIQAHFQIPIPTTHIFKGTGAVVHP